MYLSVQEETAEVLELYKPVHGVKKLLAYSWLGLALLALGMLVHRATYTSTIECRAPEMAPKTCVRKGSSWLYESTKTIALDGVKGVKVTGEGQEAELHFLVDPEAEKFNLYLAGERRRDALRRIRAFVDGETDPPVIVERRPDAEIFALVGTLGMALLFTFVPMIWMRWATIRFSHLDNRFELRRRWLWGGDEVVRPLDEVEEVFLQGFDESDATWTARFGLHRSFTMNNMARLAVRMTDGETIPLSQGFESYLDRLEESRDRINDFLAGPDGEEVQW